VVLWTDENGTLTTSSIAPISARLSLPKDKSVKERTTITVGDKSDDITTNLGHIFLEN